MCANKVYTREYLLRMIYYYLASCEVEIKESIKVVGAVLRKRKVGIV